MIGKFTWPSLQLQLLVKLVIAIVERENMLATCMYLSQFMDEFITILTQNCMRVNETLLLSTLDPNFYSVC